MVGGSDWRDVRGVVETLLGRLDADKAVKFTAAQRVGFGSGACARVEWDGRPIGFAGQIDGAVAAKLSLRHAPMACELDLTALLSGAATIARLKPLPQFPPARRDLSLLVAESVPFERIEETLRGAAGANLEAIEYVTTFRGKPLEAGIKSVTVTLVFRSGQGTLTGEQVEAAVAATVAAAGQTLGATLRQ
jgi:phenylalanyl-tRNA synthetase beta chain